MSLLRNHYNFDTSKIDIEPNFRILYQPIEKFKEVLDSTIERKVIVINGPFEYYQITFWLYENDFNFGKNVMTQYIPDFPHIIINANHTMLHTITIAGTDRIPIQFNELLIPLQEASGILASKRLGL